MTPVGPLPLSTEVSVAELPQPRSFAAIGGGEAASRVGRDLAGRIVSVGVVQHNRIAGVLQLDGGNPSPGIVGVGLVVSRREGLLLEPAQGVVQEAGRFAKIVVERSPNSVSIE